MSALTEFYRRVDRRDAYGSTIGRKRPHGGVDIAWPVGTPIPALFAGRVSKVWWSDELGWCTQVNTGDRFITYCHSNQAGRGVGAVLRQGDIVNLVGNSGNVTGPHLHLSIAVTENIGYGLAGVHDPIPYVDSVLNGGDHSTSAQPTKGIELYFDLVGNTDTKNPNGSPRDIYIVANGGALHVQTGEDLAALQAVKTGQATFRQIKLAEAYLYTLAHGYPTKLIKQVV